MAKLYFKYGAMGSSKTAQALITKYNYEENDLRVWLLKPSADVRDGEHAVQPDRTHGPGGYPHPGDRCLSMVSQGL